MTTPSFLLFASNAELAAIAGGSLLGLAVLASLAERRRVRRARIDRVGWVPWTGVFLVLFVAGATLLALGVVGLVRG